MRLSVFPLIKKGDWTFRTSIADSERIMLMAFGPTSQFMIRYFTNEDLARAFVDEAAAGKHVE